MSGRSAYRLLNASKVQLQCERNNKEHHTDEITVNRLIVRRGKPFQLTFPIETPFQATEDFFELTVETGPNASERMGTRSSFGFEARSGIGKPWSLRLISSTATSFTVSVCPPSDASIGIYSLSVRNGPISPLSTSVGKLIVLFNPWCEDDWVFMPKEEERQEYVMREHGLVYRGSWYSISPAPWDFGQFEDDIVDICLKLLDVNPKCLRNAMEDFSARCNPIYIGRVISAMVNVNDGDNGVLQGKWDIPYSDGVNPSSWNSSVDILRQWFKTGCRPVKYGQCWVFATVMCTVLRCLGIPCRVVSNFESAHDTNGNLLVDIFMNEYGVEDRKDSVWNFHVWVEAWMKRPDISDKNVYDGWQVLDPTPQEKSEGVYSCGPAPVKAILKGQTNVKYDVPFVFAEVNADTVKWIVRSDGSQSKFSTDTSSVGQFISTKTVGRDERQDITNQYKYPEGSKEERVGFSRAVRVITHPNDPEEVPGPGGILMKFQEATKAQSDLDIKLILIMQNNCSMPQDLSVQINAQTIRYTGSPTGNIYMEKKIVQLRPNEESRIPVNILFADYSEKMLDNNSIKISAIAKNENDPREVFIAEKDVVPRIPSLTIKVNGTAIQDREFSADIVFENPLPETLKNLCLTLTGSGLLQDTETARITQLSPGQRIKTTVTFWPYRTGVRKLVADLQCSAFQKISASCNINVRPF